jgi:thiol-disulfide isomerase/thioredoxin
MLYEVKTPTSNRSNSFVFLAALFLVLGFNGPAFSQTRSLVDIYNEVDGYVSGRMKELASAGKRMTSDTRNDLEDEKKALAGKYAAEVAARTDLKKTDFYYLGVLYSIAGNEIKVLETMKKFLSEYPPDTKGDMIQSARGYVIINSSKRKQMREAEDYFALWLKGDPSFPKQQPALEDYLATGYFKNGEYEPAVKHAQSAFDLLKTFKPKTPVDKRNQEQLYMNLVEVLTLSYRKSKNTDQALNVLAEARAESFAIPSANLYRKVMDFVEGSGFSEKKLMQKVESFASADPAPNLAIAEWIGQDPVLLEQFRGKVVLLDFWATWCMPCISTFPRLRGWHKKFAGDDFVLIGVTWYEGAKEGKRMSNLQELEYLKEFKEKYKLPYAFAIARPGEIQMKYGINAYPTTVLLDRNGVVRYIGIDATAEVAENLESMIEVVLKEKSQSTVSAK